MELVEITDILGGTGFGVFRSAVDEGGIVKALKVEEGRGFPGKIWTIYVTLPGFTVARAWLIRESKMPGNGNHP